MSAWHPSAIRVRYSSAGAFVQAGAKCVWHTTEGRSLPRYVGSAPHFTLNPQTGQLWQHIPINEASKALEHPDGTLETNKANAIQVELIGFALEVPMWGEAEFRPITSLARWIEIHADVPRKCDVDFTATPTHQAKRMAGPQFISYEGHCGHEHVPNQVKKHWDPGCLSVRRLLGTTNGGGPADPLAWRGVILHATTKGNGAWRVQRWINTLAKEHPGHYNRVKEDNVYGPTTAAEVERFQGRHSLTADGLVGQDTWTALRKAVGQ